MSTARAACQGKMQAVAVEKGTMSNAGESSGRWVACAVVVTISALCGPGCGGRQRTSGSEAGAASRRAEQSVSEARRASKVREVNATIIQMVIRLLLGFLCQIPVNRTHSWKPVSPMVVPINM